MQSGRQKLISKLIGVLVHVLLVSVRYEGKRVAIKEYNETQNTRDWLYKVCVAYICVLLTHLDNLQCIC